MSGKKSVLDKFAATDPPQILVFTGAGSGATRYCWNDGAMTLERGDGVLVSEWPLPEHFAVLLAAGDAYLREENGE